MTLRTLEVSIIVPKEATNLVTNPSFEIDATGYTASGAGVSIARVTTQMRRGAASCEITTATGVVSGLYYAIALTSGQSYSFSADILDVAGQTFNLWIGDAGGALKSSNTTWTGTGYWKRRSVTWTADASATFRLYITRSSVASTTKFYVDGFQLETGAVSTYIDGSLIGLVPGQTAYRWNGTPHASTSWRSGQSRAGGTYMKISTYARIVGIAGLGMAMLTNIAVPSTLGGAFYQNTVTQERPFSIVVNMTGAGDYAAIETKRAALINALKPDLTTSRQPLLLQVDQLDGSSLESAETQIIQAVYEGGLEMDGQANSYNEKVPLNFRMYLPYIQQEGEKGAALGYQTSVANANYIISRNSSGAWAAMGTGMNEAVFAMTAGVDGYLYAGGIFTLAGGVANTVYIAKWDGSAWSPLGTGMSGGGVMTLAAGPDGSLYAGGLFTLASGVANTVKIARWYGGSWYPMGTGANNTVYAIAVGNDGAVYAGGQFTDLGSADGDYIAKWNGAAWSALGTGMNGLVKSIVIAPDGTLYAGGNFTTAGGTTVNYVAKWNGAAWSALGSGMGGNVNVLAIGPDGTLYAGGTFTSVTGATGAAYIAKWNGTSWSGMNGGANDQVYALYINNNLLYVGGSFTSIGGIAPSDRMVIWNGSSFMPMEVDTPGSANLYSTVIDKSGTLYIGYSTSGTAYGATVTVPNIGSATAYPKITFTGPGTTYQLKNYTTGKSIFFNLTLLAGETAVLDLNPQRVSFTSSFRGNILNTILPGSNLNWELLPGANNVSAFMYGSTTAATAIVMTWRDQYWSIDGAVR